ncbi:hypothetical protein HAV21_12775 [Paenarthrobacter sp. MSM-2-10-13]|uniref:hypothetical protein n=1 Tax=Paenarthrobacter sp. MSM-2-10-13 TaxID=2717318 RepID=UPI00141E4021|nr:hypothetical protein [Paenarthrobacter sp. MSM-2-10-13]NHW47758.1 hypothetical protein [Paenarthrobacter sp. MSM-2-10-13]
MTCRRWLFLAAGLALAMTMPFLAACSSGSTGSPSGSGSTQPVAVEINQSRDQYGKQAILLQLTNTTDSPITVTVAQLQSPLFQGDIAWKPSAGGLELPPRQPKSLPAILPAASCEVSEGTTTALNARITYAEPGKEPVEASTNASDPFGVLSRNAGELCLASEAAAVAVMVLDPALEVAADGRTAVVRLLITPATPGTDPGSLTIESFEETTLLAQSPADPWPAHLAVGARKQELPLTIRPARCDPHAVAEDKVGTLLPLRVTVGDRRGVLKIAASNELRGRIYDFVTAACAPAG